MYISSLEVVIHTTGPSHMKSFVQDEGVRQKFTDAALSRSVLPAAADIGQIAMSNAMQSHNHCCLHAFSFGGEQS